MGSNKSRTLTYDTLFNLGACREYRERFQERFPSGSVEMTVEMAVEQAEDWDWHWAAGMIKDRDAWYERESAASEEYNKSIKPYSELASTKRVEARKVYDEVFRRVEQENYPYGYNRAYDAATAAFNEITEISRAAMNAAREVAQKRLNVAYATAFAELYIAEGEAVNGATYETIPAWEDDEDSDYEDSYYCDECDEVHYN